MTATPPQPSHATDPPQPRLVATDLDGTIVSWTGEITDRLVAVLKALGARGVPVVFVTGRPARWMADVSERTGHTGLAVCANGALLYDLGTREVVETFTLSIDAGLEVAHRLRAAIPDIAFAVETQEGFAHEETYLPRYDVGQALDIGPVESIYVMSATKLLARHEVLAPDDLLAAARDAVGDLAELTCSSESALVEISAAGVSKGSTLAKVAARLGIEAEEVVAFGDMPNDLPMLAWAGLSYGIVGGHPDVIAVADRVVEPPQREGVARELERLFGLNGHG